MKFLPSLHIYYIFSALCLGIGIDRKWTGVMPEIEPKPIWTGVMPEIEPKPINTGVMPEIEPKPEIDDNYYNYMDYLDYLEYLDYIDFIEALGIDRKSKQNQRKYQNPLRSSSSNKVIDANEGTKDQHQIDIDKNSKENQLNDNTKHELGHYHNNGAKHIHYHFHSQNEKPSAKNHDKGILEESPFNMNFNKMESDANYGKLKAMKGNILSYIIYIRIWSGDK